MLPIFPAELLGYLRSVLLNCYICLPLVLLNCYNASHLSCWIAGVLTISPVELLHMPTMSPVKLLQCFPSFLLNCLGTYHQSCWTATYAYHLSCWTAGVCLDHMQLRWITCPKGSIPESEAQFAITFPMHDRGQQLDNISLLVCCKDVKEDVASCASKIDWVLVTLVILCLRKDSKKVTYLLSSIFREVTLGQVFTSCRSIFPLIYHSTDALYSWKIWPWEIGLLKARLTQRYSLFHHRREKKEYNNNSNNDSIICKLVAFWFFISATFIFCIML